MSGPDSWQGLDDDKRATMVKLARELVRGSIIENAATRFIAMCMTEAIENSLARQPDARAIARAALEKAAKLARLHFIDAGTFATRERTAGNMIAEAIEEIANDDAELAKIVKGVKG